MRPFTTALRTQAYRLGKAKREASCGSVVARVCLIRSRIEGLRGFVLGRGLFLISTQYEAHLDWEIPPSDSAVRKNRDSPF